MFVRPQQTTLSRWLSERPSRLIVISGARQTGKTTLVRQILRRDRRADEYTYVALDEPINPATLEIASKAPLPFLPKQPDAEWLVSCWEHARRAAEESQSEHCHILVLDEIQKIPGWSDIVKGLWDSDRAVDRRLHVILLGSSPLLLQQGAQETLAGRFELLELRHWSFQEMNEAFRLDLPHYLYFGGYPGAAEYFHDPDSSRWANYVRASLVEPNIEKDVLMMRRIDKPALLKQLFELACFHSGQIVTLRKMKGQLENAGNETTLSGYLDLLAKAGLTIGLQKFANRQLRVRNSPPKLNVLNTALMTAMSGYSYDQARNDRGFWGRLVESAVGAHLHNMSPPGFRLYYWRDSDDEVDFVVERGNQRVAIEVKSTRGRYPHRGLEKFREHFSTHRTLLIGDQGVPLDVFLRSEPDDWFDGL